MAQHSTVEDRGQGSGSRAKAVAAVAAIIVLVLVARHFGSQERLREALAWVRELGAVGPAAFVAMFTLACVLFLPGCIFALGGGVLFGATWGSVYVAIGGTTGAVCAFLVGRYLARDWVRRKVAEHENFAAIDRAVGREGWKIVGLTRLSPLFPFNLLNYAFGLTSVSLRDYFLASAVVLTPWAIAYAYLGALAGDLMKLDRDGRARTSTEWAVLVVGLVAAIAAVAYVTRIARRALQERID